MCGIAGFSWKDEKLGAEMSGAIIHRGPDASGIFSADGITLSHRRLSIIDLSSAANQPMYGEEVVIVFNGEIYNYKELRAELQGYQFKTESDTEVIIAGYKSWGREVVKKLNGIFSFAIWDKKDCSLFCARDHMGVKPLYYYWDGKRLIFASEMKAIFVHDIPRKLNLSAFNDYLRVLYVPEPSTMVENVNKLPPGSTLLLKNREITVEKYYEPKPAVSKRSYREALNEVGEKVEESVERQLVSDVPVGVYLSGGIDSSAVLASVAKVRSGINTYSVGFELASDEDEFKFNRDFNLARETAKHFGTSHHELKLSAKDISESLEEIIGNLDDPISNPTAIPMGHLAKFAKRGVTVVLSGNGGDELFGGYERYRTAYMGGLARKVPLLKQAAPRSMSQLLNGSSLDLLAQFEFEKDHRLRKVIRSEFMRSMEDIKLGFKRYINESSDRASDLMLADLKSWLPDQALSLGDKMSMYGSVEERVPLLDREVVDLALSLPTGFKVGAFRTKKILKDAFKAQLPEALFKEPKRGWFAPGAKWLRRHDISTLAREILSEGYYHPTSTLFDWEELKKMLENHIEKREYNLTILWAILTFQIWAKKYRIVA